MEALLAPHLRAGDRLPDEVPPFRQPDRTLCTLRHGKQIQCAQSENVNGTGRGAPAWLTSRCTASLRCAVCADQAVCKRVC